MHQYTSDCARALSAMHRLRKLAALAPLLASASRSSLATSAATVQPAADRLACVSISQIAHTSRFAAAAAARGFATGPEESGSSASASFEERRVSNANTSTSQLSDDQQPAWMEDWARLIEKGDLAGQAELVKDIFGEEPEPVGPPLHELLNYSRKEEERAKRRLAELQKQEEIRQSRVSVIDKFGRSYGTGKRKTSIARVWLKQGTGSVVINGKRLNDYFGLLQRRSDVLAPFLTTNTLGLFDIRATVQGGGNTGQSQALRHGISKALQLFDPQFRPALKAEGLLSRDSRIVERKKPGKAKARKSFQWVKR